MAGEVPSCFSWKQRQQKPPPRTTPPSQKNSSQRYLHCDGAAIWAGAAVAADLAPLRWTQVSAVPRPMAEAPEQDGSLCDVSYLAAPLVLSAYGEDKLMPFLHPQSPKSKLFLFSPFINILYLVILPAARVVYIDPFHCRSLLLCVYPCWLMALKFVLKRGNSACWCISDSCFLLTVLPRITIFPPGVNSGLHWVSGNFAFSFHRAKIFSVIFRYCREFAPPFTLSACPETCFLCSLSTLFLFLPVPFPLNVVLRMKVLVGKPGEIFSGEP